MILREMATLWVRANIPYADVQAIFVQHLENSIRRQVTCSFTIGHKLTKSNRPFLVYGFRGELFVFELSPEQAHRLGIKETEIRCADSIRPATWNQAIEPMVRLDNIRVEGSTSLDRESRITGSLSYRSERSFLEPLALRVVCDPPGRGCTTFYHHLSLLKQPEGDMKFATDKLGDLTNKQGEKFVGIVPLFFQIWTAAELQNPQPASLAFPKPTPVHVQPAGFEPRNRLPSSARVAVSEPSSAQPPKLDRPISDIRAVLVDVV
jgi:hypothetical protein